MIVAGASVALASHESAAGQGDAAQGVQTAAQPLENAATPTPSSGLAFTGMITDSHCRARHLRNSGMNPAECARACFRKGATYMLIDGDRHYTLIGDDESLSRLAGERASVIGTRQGDTILVNSAKSLF